MRPISGHNLIPRTWKVQALIRPNIFNYCHHNPYSLNKTIMISINYTKVYLQTSNASAARCRPRRRD